MTKQTCMLRAQPIVIELKNKAFWARFPSMLKYPEICARILGSELMSLSDLESPVRSFSSDSYHGSLVQKV